MINPNELWVGDTLQVISIGIVGKYDSHKGSIVIIDCKGNKISADKSDIRIYTQPKQEVKIAFEDEVVLKSKIKFNDTLDLHLNILAPHMEHQEQSRILDFQIEKARQFVEDAIENNRSKILIIHGKGSGVLKSETLEMLKDFYKVRYTFDKNDGGATEIWLDI
ncbi:MAG: hypothetical protein CMN33_00235 [Saprospirales bacterium]|nr:hypothetical protein [Saprospirales bacterium]|tara:strand:+ start:655 stop:1146 length:492 start_codon:yes stop_codon:yes gene_type:complete